MLSTYLYVFDESNELNISISPPDNTGKVQKCAHLCKHRRARLVYMRWWYTQVSFQAEAWRLEVLFVAVHPNQAVHIVMGTAALAAHDHADERHGLGRVVRCLSVP